MRRRVLAVVGAVLAGLVLTSPAEAGSGWVWPLDGPHTVGRAFDPPATRYGPGHRGADLPGAPGAVVRAAGAGVVSYAGLLAGRGVVVVVHGDLRTTYEPVSAAVHVGQHVVGGQPIGRLTRGHAGCGSCLHWGLLRGEVYLDPVLLVRRGPSRLLPLDQEQPAGLAQPALPPTAPAGATGRPSAPALRRSGQPAFALRAADAGWGSAALVALVAGLVLLGRPKRPPRGPAHAGSVVVPATASSLEPVGRTVSPPVSLDAERARRRA